MCGSPECVLSPVCVVRTPPLSLRAPTSHLPGGGDTSISGLFLMPHGDPHLPVKVGFQVAKSLRPAPSPRPGVCGSVSGAERSLPAQVLERGVGGVRPWGGFVGTGGRLRWRRVWTFWRAARLSDGEQRSREGRACPPTTVSSRAQPVLEPVSPCAPRLCEATGPSFRLRAACGFAASQQLLSVSTSRVRWSPSSPGRDLGQRLLVTFNRNCHHALASLGIWPPGEGASAWLGVLAL